MWHIKSYGNGHCWILLAQTRIVHLHELHRSRHCCCTGCTDLLTSDSARWLIPACTAKSPCRSPRIFPIDQTSTSNGGIYQSLDSLDVSQTGEPPKRPMSEGYSDIVKINHGTAVNSQENSMVPSCQCLGLHIDQHPEMWGHGDCIVATVYEPAKNPGIHPQHWGIHPGVKNLENLGIFCCKTHSWVMGISFEDFRRKR